MGFGRIIGGRLQWENCSRATAQTLIHLRRVGSGEMWRIPPCKCCEAPA